MARVNQAEVEDDESGEDHPHTAELVVARLRHRERHSDENQEPGGNWVVRLKPSDGQGQRDKQGQ